MAPFTGGFCFIGNDQYDIANDNITNQDIKPIRRRSIRNFIRCIQRKRKSRNKNLVEETTVSSQEQVKTKVESELEFIKKTDTQNDVSCNLEIPVDQICVSDTSRLCVEEKFPNKELSDSVPKEEIYKCVACGETKQCQKDLVEHLMKHVYEGLNAAVWLSTAMNSFVNYPNVSIDAQCMSNSQSANGNL